MQIGSPAARVPLPTLKKGDRGGFLSGHCLCGNRKSLPRLPLGKAGATLRIARTSHLDIGFTLIEVLVALAILAIALAAAARAASVAIEGAQETRLRTLATWIAQNRVAELMATPLLTATGEISGRSSMAGIEFEWQQKISETPNTAFRKIELKVLRPARAQSLVTLNAYLVRPPGSGS